MAPGLRRPDPRDRIIIHAPLDVFDEFPIGRSHSSATTPAGRNGEGSCSKNVGYATRHVRRQRKLDSSKKRVLHSTLLQAGTAMVTAQNPVDPSQRGAMVEPGMFKPEEFMEGNQQSCLVPGAAFSSEVVGENGGERRANRQEGGEYGAICPSRHSYCRSPITPPGPAFNQSGPETNNSTENHKYRENTDDNGLSLDARAEDNPARHSDKRSDDSVDGNRGSLVKRPGPQFARRSTKNSLSSRLCNVKDTVVEPGAVRRARWSAQDEFDYADICRGGNGGIGFNNIKLGHGRANGDGDILTGAWRQESFPRKITCGKERCVQKSRFLPRPRCELFLSPAASPRICTHPCCKPDEGGNYVRRRQSSNLTWRPEERMSSTPIGRRLWTPEIDDKKPKPKLLNEALVRRTSDMLLFSKKARPVEFKPCTLKEYRETKPFAYMELGKLQPDLNTEELVAKRANADRVKEFSVNLRQINSDAAARRGKSRTAPTTAKPQDARSRALAFARRIPLPDRTTANRRTDGSNKNEVPTGEPRELTELEALEALHYDMRKKVQESRTSFS
ncbi:unnamed protein product [Ascophyllum nodosum]